jgi:hypothetical protein
MFSGSERGGSLNATAVLTEVRRRLEEFGLGGDFDCAVASDRGLDALVHLTTGFGAARTYAVQVKQRLTPELATAVHVQPHLPVLMAAPFISDPVAERLRARGIDYVDTVGNAHVAWEGVLIDVRGRRKSAVSLPKTSTRGARAFSRAGLKVEFVLLSWPEMASQPLRQLAHASGVSLGTAKMVVDELTTAGYLYEGSSGRRLARGGELLNRWSEAYSIVLDPALSLGEFSTGDLSWWRQSERELLQLDIQVGGEAAASLLDSYLHPSSLTLYVHELPLQLIGRHRMARAAGDGNVHVRQRFWRVPERVSWIVPSTLIYADLLASGDPRQREHADRIRTSDDRLTRLDRT